MTSEIQYVQGDATAPEGEGVMIIAHVCNNAGLWGAGFTRAVSRKWPQPEAEYRRFYQMGHDLLGHTLAVEVDAGLYVANMVAQKGVGTSKRRIQYDDLVLCLIGLRELWAKPARASVHMPRIGCGLGGGSWTLIEPLIQEELCTHGIPVTIYDLPGVK